MDGSDYSMVERAIVVSVVELSVKSRPRQGQAEGAMMTVKTPKCIELGCKCLWMKSRSPCWALRVGVSRLTQSAELAITYGLGVDVIGCWKVKRVVTPRCGRNY